MNLKDLKYSILQFAIQGKLVEQRKEEGSAESLVKKLIDAKKVLLSENKIYKKKPTKPFYNLNELPFEIPESWMWVQLSDISIIQEGAGIRKHQYKDFGVQLFSVTNILEGSVDLEKKKLYVSTEEFIEKYTHLQLNKGDIVTACSGGSWGKVAVYEKDDIVMLNTSTLRLRFFEDIGNNRYLYYLVQSAFFKKQLHEQLVGIQPNFGYAHYSRICIPLPPLEEQNRIVAKIEEIMPYIDKYGEAYLELEKLNKEFPDKIQKSILQYAMQGKLVEQDPNDEPAQRLIESIQLEKERLIKEKVIKKEKPLPSITEEEIPFDIPSSWAWVRLGNVVRFISGYAYKSSAYVNDSKYQIIRLGNVKKNKLVLDAKPIFISEDLAKQTDAFKIKENDILVTMTGTKGKKDYFYTCLVNPFDVKSENLYLNQRVGCIRPLIDEISNFLIYILQLPLIIDKVFEKETGTANQGNLGIEAIRNLLIPVPPLGEQKRIVSAIGDIMSSTEKFNDIN